MKDVRVIMLAGGCVLYKSAKDWGNVRTCLQNGLDTYVKRGSEHNITLKALLVCNKAERGVINNKCLTMSCQNTRLNCFGCKVGCTVVFFITFRYM